MNILSNSCTKLFLFIEKGNSPLLLAMENGYPKMSPEIFKFFKTKLSGNLLPYNEFKKVYLPGRLKTYLDKNFESLHSISCNNPLLCIIPKDKLSSESYFLMQESKCTDSVIVK